MALEEAAAMRYGATNDVVACAEDGANRFEGGAARWYALAVKPRFDKAVAKTLRAKEYPTFLPLYTMRHKYGNRCKESELPLFPGYVFCRFNALAKLPILTTPGVIQIVGTGNAPAAVSDAEMSSLQIAVRARFSVEPFPFLQVGQRVRINRGALAGVEGIVISVKQRLRLVLSITLLQRSVMLEIDRAQISADEVPSWAVSRCA